MHYLCSGLVKKGHAVTALTGFPNYPKGKTYVGYKQKVYQKELIDGVRVIRIPVYPDRSRSFLKRSLNNLSFPAASSILGGFLTDRPDVMLVQHPPITLGIPAYLISRIHRIPFVFLIQDMWPETLPATGMVSNPTILKAIGRLAKFTYAKAKSIAVISPGFKRNLVEKGVPEEKVEVIYNCAYESSFPSVEKDHSLGKELGLIGYFNILYAGNIGPAQGLHNVIDAASLLTDIQDLHFVFMGDGVERERLERTVVERSLRNIKFVNRIPMEKMPFIYAQVEAVMVHLTDDPLFEITIPGKTQSCLLSGRPIIASVNGDAADLVVKAGAGFAVKAMDPDGLAQAVRGLYNMPSNEREAMGLSGRNFYLKNLSPEVQVKKYEQLFKEIIERRN
jgi:glycosyltransferase involved in cell wall biosynthesis